MSRSKTVKTPKDKFPRKGRLAPLGEVRQRLLADPEVKLHYDELRIREEIGTTITVARKDVGLTQAKLAELAGTKQSVIARLEIGRAHV